MGINMIRKFICILVLVVYCLIQCGCGAKKTPKNLSESINKKNITTANPKDMLNMYIEERESTGYTDFGSNIYWSNIFEEKKKEIDYIVNWFKNISYCEDLSFDADGDVKTLPDNEETRKKIQNEKNFEKIKELITINNYDISNYWLEDNEIIISHDFKLEEIEGKYCLVYEGNERKKLEEDYKEVDENYYSYVSFYE